MTYDGRASRRLKEELAQSLRRLELYDRLLSLRSEERPDLLIDEVLTLFLEITGGEAGYLELRQAGADTPTWWRATGCTRDDVDAIRELVSTGIIREALRSDRVVNVPWALEGSAFSENTSVQRGKLGAVLCVPLRSGDVQGVVYVAGPATPGGFDEDQVEDAQRVAELVSVLADRLVLQARGRSDGDPTQVYREALSLEGVVGRSEALAAVLAKVFEAAQWDRTPVLIQGPTGTGKSMLARVIHDNSVRRGGPFVSLQCGTLPEDSTEGELFGVESKAFTDVAARPGLVEQADGGTLLLDDFTVLPLHLQTKLLEVTQSGRFRRRGGREERASDFRLVATTNEDPEEAVADGRLRADLYYRLRGIVVAIPPLAERREDIGALAGHIAREYCSAHGRPEPTLTPQAVAWLTARPWPGNVRDLASEVWDAVRAAYSRPGNTTVDREHFAGAGSPPRDGAGTIEAMAAAFAAEEAPPSLREARDRIERAYLAATLESCGNNVTRSAKQLEIDRKYLYRLLKKHE